MNFKTKRTIHLLLGIASFMTIVIISTISYAYFTTTTTTEKQEGVLTTGVAKVRFADGNPGFMKELKFGESATKTFTIENTGTIDTYVTLHWMDLVNTYLPGSLTYSLEYRETDEGDYQNIIDNEPLPISEVPTSTILAENLPISNGKSYEYNLIVTLNNLKDIDQTQDLSAHFNTKFDITEVGKENSFGITFDANGGIVKTSGKRIPLTAKTYGPLPTATREYYKFKGWYTDSIAGTQILEESEIEDYRDRTVYAHWEIVGKVPTIIAAMDAGTSPPFVNVGDPVYANTSPILNVGTEVVPMNIIEKEPSSYFNEFYITNKVTSNFPNTFGWYTNGKIDLNALVSEEKKGVALCYDFKFVETNTRMYVFLNGAELLQANGERTGCIGLGEISQDDKISIVAGNMLGANPAFQKEDHLEFELREAEVYDDSGIYSLEDNDGPSYYFRGNVYDNYVSFAGFYWRVVRINGDGSLRLLYDGTSAHLNDEESDDRIIKDSRIIFNNSYNNLDTWYENNLKDYEAMLETGNFCEDGGAGLRFMVDTSAAATAVLNPVPTFKCPSLLNDKKVGFITADEIVAAGSGKAKTVNTNYYLHKGFYYWTGSPRSGTNPQRYFFVDYNGQLHNGTITASFYVVPVINIKKDIAKNFVGNGTLSNPYRIEEASAAGE